MKVLLDMDGVLANTTDVWLAEYRAMTGDALFPHDLKAYDFAAFAKYPDMIWKSLAIGHVFTRAQPMPDAIPAARALIRAHDVYVVTYSHESVRDGHRAKLDWLNHWLPELAEDRVIFTKHKHMVDGDIMVEDYPANLDSWLNSSEDRRRGYLVNHGYNKSFEAPDDITRIDSLWAVVHALQKIK